VIPRLLDLEDAARPGSADGDRVSFTPLGAPHPSQASRVEPALAAVMGAEERGLTRSNARPVHAPGFYSLADALVTGEGYPWIEERLACARSTMPRYWQAMVMQDGLSDPGAFAERSIPSPAVLFHARDYNNYGHFWLDIAPRLFLLKRERPEVFATLAFIVPGDLAGWAREALGELHGITPGQLVSFDPSEERLRCPRLLVPTLVHADYAFHPLANAFYDDVVERRQEAGSGPAQPFLYLTRQAYTREVVPWARQLVNAADAEELAESLGFLVVAPERLPWRRQVALFAQAQVVVGEHGSAMKNLLFAPAGSAAVSINCLNETQSRIAALRGQGLVTLLAMEESPGPLASSYCVDLGRLKTAIEAAQAWCGASDS
jgi:hypothetical protein